VTGSEDCIFNLAFKDSGLDSLSNDFLDTLLASNRQVQLWAILKLPEPGQNFTPMALDEPNYFKEICSINVMAAITGCANIALDRVFGSRIFSSENIIYLIRSNYICHNDGLVGFQYQSTHYHVDVVMLSVPLETLHVIYAHSYCITCPPEYTLLQLPVRFNNILSVHQFVADVKKNSFESKVAALSQRSNVFTFLDTTLDHIYCHFLLKTRPSRDTGLIGCIAMHILVENIADHLNYSVEYVTMHNVPDFYGGNLRHYYPIVTFLNIAFWIKGDKNVSPGHYVKQILSTKDTAKFFYCTANAERERFSFLFWTIPFDTGSWVLIGISVIVLSGILRGDWFPIFAILMRQDCRILTGKKKLFIIFILVTIVFTYGYEGVISSFLTVNPPLIVHQMLRDLLNTGYKIRVMDTDDLDLYNPVFRKGNITESIEASVTILSVDVFFNKVIYDLSQCNTTQPISAKDEKYYKSRVARNSPESSCKSVRDSFESTDSVFQVIGVNRIKFSHVLERIIESGIKDFYITYDLYLILSPSFRAMDLLDEEENRETPFKMSDWKILSIFVALAVFLAASIFVLAVEVMYVRVKT